MLFQHEDAGDIEVRRVGWAEFKEWGDGFARERVADANQNLWASIAIRPTAAELVELVEDFSALPMLLVDAVIAECGSPGGIGGLGERCPVITLAEAEAARAEADKLDAQITALPDAGHEEQLRVLMAGRAALDSRLVPPDMLAAARKRSRRAFFVRTPAGLWAMRPPGREASAAYQEGMAAFGQGKAGSSFCETMRGLTVACVLSPDPEAVKAAIEEYPALPWRLGPELNDRAGGGKALVRVS